MMIVKHESSVSRRRFLKSSAALAATGTVLGSSFAPALGQSNKTLRVLTVGDPFYYSLNELLGDFTAQTGIEVELESLSYDAMQARLVSSFVSKTADADVVTVDQMWTGQYVDNGWIIPLDELAMGDAELDIKGFIPEVLHSLNTWRGQLVTLPVAAYAQGVMYRPSVFEELGIAPPAESATTWADYLGVAQQIQGKSAGGKTMNGTVLCGAQPVPIVHMFTQISASHGVRWFKSFPEGEWDFEPTIASDMMKQAVDLYAELYKVAPPEAVNYNWFEAGTRFSQGDIGLFYWWTPYFYLVKNDGYMTGEKSSIIDDYAVANLPVAGDTPQTTSLGGWSFGIPSTTEKSVEAWRFLKWASSEATQKKMALLDKFNYQFSDFARTASYDDEEIRAIYPYLDAQRQMMASGNGKIARPPVPVYSTLEGILGLELNKVLVGESDADAALKNVETLFTNTLKGNFLIPYSLASFDDTPAASQALVDRLA